MKNTKQLVATILAIVLLVAGALCVFMGVKGQEVYNTASALLGTKKADTVNFILDPDTITEVAHDMSEGDITNFLVKDLGLDAAEVKDIVSARAKYDVEYAKSQDNDQFIEYIMEKDGISKEDATSIRKDKKQAPAYREQMLKDLLAENLGADEDEIESLIADEDMIGLVKKGFTNLNEGKGKATLFKNAIMYLFIGIVLAVAGFAYFFIRLMDDSRQGKKGGAKKSNPKLEKVGDFLLNYALYIILIVILAVVCILRPNFLEITNILNIIKQSSTKGILALGCAGLIVLAGTDLSIGRILGVCAAVTASLVQSVTYASRMFPQITEQLPVWVPLLASIAVAVLFTLFNGFGVAKLHLHAFIITLGTQLIAQGLCCIYIESQPSGTAQALSTFDRKFLDFAAGNFNIGSFALPKVVVYFLIIALIMWVVWNKTRLGKNMFAVGGNEEAARVSGVNVAKTIMLVYLMAGVLYGISAYLEAARITSCGANTGINYETDAISACVVGGVSFSGGVGTIQGVVIGAVLLQAINYSLNFLGINPYLQYVVRGLIIILAVSIDVRKYIAKK
ncbi:MAG: galactose/methyl galactoside ABC transporter permease MglC [Eubacteriales bacterium]|nr:galactose/methyl galactoside ABC transporter permease MglC [Eubacteriales bacterium]